MGNMRLQWMTIIALVTVALAGCSDVPMEEDDNGEEFQEFQLEATKDTGVIRGVVVDDAIRPIMGAMVVIEGTQESATSNANGAFGFSDVEPGIVRLVVDAQGFGKVTQTVEVVAGVDKPEIVKVLLPAALSELPYVEAFTFNGFIACSASTPAYRVAVCGAVNLVFGIAGQPPPTDDEFLAGFEIDKYPDFIQSEMVWDSTQPAGDYLMLTVERASVDGADIGTEAGLSPLVLRADNETITAAGMHTSGYMQQRVFNMEHPLTTPPVPICGVPNPVHGGTMCVKGWGLTVDQAFEVFTHNFHKFVPAEDWVFIEDGSPTPP